MSRIGYLRAKFQAMKEERMQRHEMGRDSRLAQIKREKDYYQRQKAERVAVREVKLLRAEERREKYKPFTNFANKLGGVAKNVQKSKLISSGGRQLSKGAGVKPKQAKKDIFSIPKREDLFGAQDVLDKK
jgi:hypothetical protein